MSERPRSWTMWAGQRMSGEGEMVFCHTSPNERYVRAYGKDPVQVVVTENPQGLYWAWLPLRDRMTDEPLPDAFPRFVYEREYLLSMCFPYGYANEEATGRGRLIRLDICEMLLPDTVRAGRDD